MVLACKYFWHATIIHDNAEWCIRDVYISDMHVFLKMYGYTNKTHKFLMSLFTIEQP